MSTAASSSTEEQATAQVQDETSTNQKPKLTSKDLRYSPVFLLYNGYLVSKADAQDDGLENFKKLCRRFNYIPSVDLVNFIISDANLVDPKHRLNFPVYAFMQEFKFKLCAPDGNQDPRLFVGNIHLANEIVLEVWAGWPKSTKFDRVAATAANTVLYHAPIAQKGGYVLDFGRPEAREHIVWYEPLETLFGMSKLVEGKNLNTAVQVQNAILLSVTKVILTFPGLMDLGPGTENRLASSADSSHRFFSGRPFDGFDEIVWPWMLDGGKRKAYYIGPGSPWLGVRILLDAMPSVASGQHRCHPPDSEEFASASKKRKRGNSDDEDPTSAANLVISPRIRA